jgi:hypothetical protein
MKIEGSSTIDVIEYNPTEKICTVTFKGEITYSYQPINPSLWTQFSNAKSKGEFFAQNIRYKKGLIVRKLVGGTFVSVVKASERSPSKAPRPKMPIDNRKIHEISSQFHQIIKQR